MTLSRFSRVMIGTKTYLDLLIELSSIFDIKDFFIVVRRQGLNYKIMEMADSDFKILKYPKKFRKTIYDAEPPSQIQLEDDEGESTPINMLFMRESETSYEFYRVKISESHIDITDAYFDGEEKNKGFKYWVRAPLHDTNPCVAWIR